MHNNKIRKDGYSVLYMCCNGGKDSFKLMGKLEQIMEDILHKVLDQLLAKTILWK